MRRGTQASLRTLLAALALPGLVLQAADPVPMSLPRPDGKPGDAAKPVKVYLLAGQSNMVGMGDRGGARPPYPSVFLSADPAVISGSMPIGGSAIAAHGVYPSKDPESGRGAMANVYKGAYDPNADYARETPAKVASFPLGTVSETLPSIEGPHTVVVNAFVDVPATGCYTLHAGFEDSTHAVVTLEGREVYRKEIGGKPVIEKVVLKTGTRYPIVITYLKGGSAAFWMEQVDLEGKGDLETVTKKDKKFRYLVDDSGTWTVRNDVYYYDARIGFKGSPLSPVSNGNSIGPELGFGHVMGTFHDEQVLLIKTAMGNRALGFDFRPPSSGRTQPDNEWESLEYKLMVEGVRKTLARIDEIVPGYNGQGYEIAGFGWFQGHKDSFSEELIAEYEKNLVNLINDVRKEFNVPAMPAVVAAVGFGGYRMADKFQGIRAAQMAVGDAGKHPEFAGTAASVDTRDFWREVEESPRSQDYHYNRNAETYLLVGESMGRAMVRLLGGEAEAIPKSDREARVAAETAAQAAKPAPTAEQKAASLAALKPMILDGALVAFVNNPRYRPELESALEGKRPSRVSPLLNDALDEAAAYYRAAGIDRYDWKPFGRDMTNTTWEYFSFNLPDVQPDPEAKVIPVAKVTYPAGMDDWFAPGFDARKAGWKSGAASFGERSDDLELPDWLKDRIGKRAPATLCEDDVLLLRRTFDLPPLREGHRYRIRIGGSVHNNMGEGYAIYVNGKLLAESKGGIVAWRREGHRPRGGHVYAEFREEFKGGKVVIAVGNFPMDNRPIDRPIPPGDTLSIWMEEMRIPPLE